MALLSVFERAYLSTNYKGFFLENYRNSFKVVEVEKEWIRNEKLDYVYPE